MEIVTEDGDLMLERCVKCGARNPHLEYRDQVIRRDQATEYVFKFVGGCLVSTCLRCGYEWVVESIDEGKQ